MDKIKTAKILAGINILVAIGVMWSFWGLKDLKLTSPNMHVYNFSVGGSTTLVSVLFLIGIGLLLNSIAILLIKTE